jgi:hypothetical protein
MGINELLASEIKRKQDENANLQWRAEKVINSEASRIEEMLKSRVPALFNGKYPIRKWVVIEPPEQFVGGTCAWTLAVVLENNLLLYCYRNSACTEMCCAEYEKGSAECWAKMPSSPERDELASNPTVNEKNLARMINSIMDRRRMVKRRSFFLQNPKRVTVTGLVRFISRS